MSDDRLQISREQLSQIKERTGRSLARVIGCTPDDAGDVIGTGTFLNLFGATYIATAEHVVKTKFSMTSDGERRYDGLAHDTGAAGPVFRITNPFYSHGRLRDVAVAGLRTDDFVGTNVVPLPLQGVPKFTPSLNDEILLLHGYPGKASRFVRAWNGIVSTSFPWVCTQEPPPSCDWFDPTIHFAVGYPAHGTDERGHSTVMPDPHGLSGSAIWKTNVVARGALWTIDDIQMIGIATDWNQDAQVIIGVRVEFLWVLLFHAIQLECAYAHWVGRGRPHGDDWADWFAAEKHVEALQRAAWTQ